jgi:hypothetical protein
MGNHYFVSATPVGAIPRRKHRYLVSQLVGNALEDKHSSDRDPSIRQNILDTLKGVEGLEGLDYSTVNPYSTANQYRTRNYNTLLNSPYGVENTGSGVENTRSGDSEYGFHTIEENTSAQRRKSSKPLVKKDFNLRRYWGPWASVEETTSYPVPESDSSSTSSSSSNSYYTLTSPFQTHPLESPNIEHLEGASSYKIFGTFGESITFPGCVGILYFTVFTFWFRVLALLAREGIRRVLFPYS